MIATSSYAGGIRDVLHGVDTARSLKSMSSGLLFGNANVEIATRIRNDNPSVVEHVHSITPAAKERRSNCFLESNREEMGPNPRLAVSHITAHLKVSGEMAKTTTRTKLILLLSRNIFKR